MYEYESRPATEAEAHAEWHINAGIPMGTPGCPWDACHMMEEHEEPEWLAEKLDEEAREKIDHANRMLNMFAELRRFSLA